MGPDFSWLLENLFFDPLGGPGLAPFPGGRQKRLQSCDFLSQMVPIVLGSPCIDQEWVYCSIPKISFVPNAYIMLLHQHNIIMLVYINNFKT